MGRVKCDHIKRLITLTSDNIRRLSLYILLFYTIASRFRMSQCNFFEGIKMVFLSINFDEKKMLRFLFAKKEDAYRKVLARLESLNLTA